MAYVEEIHNRYAQSTDELNKIRSTFYGLMLAKDYCVSVFTGAREEERGFIDFRTLMLRDYEGLKIEKARSTRI
jgi:hypothetical protein